MTAMNHLFDLLEKILGSESPSVELEIPEENFNLLAVRIVREKAKQEHKNLTLKPTGPRGKRLLAHAGEEVLATPAKVSLGGVGRFIKVPLILLGLLLALGGGAYALLYWLPQATVTLTLSPIPLVKEIAVVASTEATSIEVAAGTVPATLRTVEQTGEKSTPATGTATVGEKAKGTVTFNSTVANNCAQGTKVKEDSSGLTFLTDSSFSISASETKDISVTAEKIGSDYNLASGRHFAITSGCDNNIAMEGDNSAAFTGGSSQQVTVVAATDQNKLLEDLEKELIEAAKEKILSGAGVDEVIVDTAIKNEVIEKIYSHDVGEQAENVTLTLKIKLTTITYKGSDIQELVAQAMAELVPPGFILFPGGTIIDPLDPQLSEKTLSFQDKITAQVIPDLDQEAIRNDLSGRNLESAEQYLASLSDITAYKLEIWPNLPEPLRRVPANKDRIKIILETKED